jgi:periplasmic protein TonB
MAPSAIVERLDLGQALTPEAVEILPLGKRAAKPERARAIQPAFEFSKVVLLEENHFKTGSRMLDVAISVLLHVVVIAAPILAGLYFTDTINIKQLASTMLIAPPPPPPPPPPALSAVIRPPVLHRLFMNGGKLFAPTVIPKQIAEIKEAPLEPDPNLGGVADGVPGGVPGGQLGGVLGGGIGGVLNTARPVAPPSGKTNAPLRVGGRVRPPRPIIQTKPEYPALARQAHIRGQVEIDAVLDDHGNVVEMKIVSGPPVLYQAALDALKKWKYEPTYLNDQPVAVQMLVTISFQLGQ